MITLQEAREYLNDLRALPGWEAKLDDEIRKSLAAKTATAVAGITLPYENLARMLAARYEKAGWSVELSDVTRDRVAAEPQWHVQVNVEESLP